MRRALNMIRINRSLRMAGILGVARIKATKASVVIDVL